MSCLLLLLNYPIPHNIKLSLHTQLSFLPKKIQIHIPSTMWYKSIIESVQFILMMFLCHALSFSLTHSFSPYVGQSMSIDIFSVYQSPESRIGDHPRNRLSHFYVLQKWSGQALSSISLFDWVSTLQPLIVSMTANSQEHFRPTPSWGR